MDQSQSAPPNPLANEASTSGASPPGPSITDAFKAHLESTQAQYNKVSGASKSFATIRAGLDSIAKLGEAITSDDVVEEMGKLVGAGIAPEGLIAMIAGDPASGVPPMPESGQALAAWVQALEQKFQAQEQQVKSAHSMAAHQLGATGAQGLLLHHMEALRGQQAPEPSTPTNPLTVH